MRAVNFPPEVDKYEVVERYIKAIDKGILKVMSKMGISTYQSYCGAQIFDAVGLSSEFVEEYFTGTATPHRRRRPCRNRRGNRRASLHLPFPMIRFCEMRWISAANMPSAIRGERHAWNANNIAALQHAVRGNSYERFKDFSSRCECRSKGTFNHPRHVQDQGRCRNSAANPFPLTRLNRRPKSSSVLPPVQ